MMRRHVARAAVLVSLGCGCLPAVALAHSQITGVVTDPSGAVLPGVTIEAASRARPQVRGQLPTPSRTDSQHVDGQ